MTYKQNTWSGTFLSQLVSVEPNNLIQFRRTYLTYDCQVRYLTSNQATKTLEIETLYKYSSILKHLSNLNAPLAEVLDRA
jgi:hypothetical protein